MENLEKNEIKYTKFNYTDLIVSTVVSRNCTTTQSDNYFLMLDLKLHVSQSIVHLQSEIIGTHWTIYTETIDAKFI